MTGDEQVVAIVDHLLDAMDTLPDLGAPHEGVTRLALLTLVATQLKYFGLKTDHDCIVFGEEAGREIGRLMIGLMSLQQAKRGRG